MTNRALLWVILAVVVLAALIFLIHDGLLNF